MSTSTARVAPVAQSTARVAPASKANAPVAQSKATAPAMATAKAPATATAKAPATATATPKAMGKNASAAAQVGRPQAKMLRVIATIPGKATKGLRPKRWDAYKVGMTLQHCRQTAGLDHLDVLFYVDAGLMTLREATDAEYDAAVKAWKADAKADAVALLAALGVTTDAKVA